MIPNKTDIRKLIVKYLFFISAISLIVSFFTRNIGAGIISAIAIIFCGVYLLVSKKEKKFFDKWKTEHIKKYFGNGYQKVLVVSDQSLTEEIGDLLTSKGVTCYKFSKIISDLKKLMRNKSYDDDAIRFLGLVFEHECT